MNGSCAAALQLKEIALLLCEQKLARHIPPSHSPLHASRHSIWHFACAKVLGRGTNRKRHFSSVAAVVETQSSGSVLCPSFWTPWHPSNLYGTYGHCVELPCLPLRSADSSDESLYAPVDIACINGATGAVFGRAGIGTSHSRLPFAGPSRTGAVPPQLAILRPPGTVRYGSNGVKQNGDVDADVLPPQTSNSATPKNQRQGNKEAVTLFRSLVSKTKEHQPAGFFDEIWSAWTALRGRSILSQLKPEEVFGFAEYLERLDIMDNIANDRQSVGSRLWDVVTELQRRFSIPLDRPVNDGKDTPIDKGRTSLQRLQILHAWASVLLDRREEGYDRLVNLFRERGGAPHISAVLCLERIFRDTWRVHSADAAIAFLLDGFTHYQPVISKSYSRKVPGWNREFKDASARLREALADAFISFTDPIEWLAGKRELWDEQRQRRAGRLMLTSMISRRRLEDSLAVYTYLRDLNLHIPLKDMCALVDSLVLREAYREAEYVFQDTIAKQQEFFPDVPWWTLIHRTAFRLAAHQGQVQNAESHYRELESRHSVENREKAWLMHAYAVSGDADQAARLFNDFFPGGQVPMADGAPNRPDTSHFNIVILAYARRGDFKASNQWLSSMLRAGFKPDPYAFHIMLAEFAARGDIESVRSVLDQMKANGVERNEVTYTALLSLHAQRRDAFNAEKIMRQAMSEGLLPDRQMLTTLVDAHVRAASWKGVIRTFDWIMTLPHRSLRLTTALCNTLLKAYVLIGAPFYTVVGVFRKLHSFEVSADERTYALVIQSACDSGRMFDAEDLFREMQTACNLAQDSPVNVYALTILMAGYLRKEDRARAQEVYQNMIERNVQPSTVTFAIIIRSYANEKSSESLAVAEDFLKEVLRQPPSDRAKAGDARVPELALQYLFTPLMQGFAEKLDPSKVEALLAQMLQLGGVASIEALSILMDAYRRIGNIDAVEQVWVELHKQGLERLKRPSLFQDSDEDSDASHGSVSSVPRSYANWLSIPLSIYIDALSTAGRHADIASTWVALRNEGFTFDAHNWNHMAVAMLKAGEPERAFDVLERVILRYQRDSERLRRDRDTHPRTPFIFDLSPEMDVQPERDGVLRDAIDIPVTVGDRRAQQTINTQQQVPLPGEDVQGEREIQSVEDFVHTLHVLHQVSPSWNLWRPHESTLRALGGFLTGGQLTDSEGNREFVDLGLSANIRKADVLQKIYSLYPSAVQVVLEYQAYRAQRMQSNPTNTM